MPLTYDAFQTRKVFILLSSGSCLSLQLLVASKDHTWILSAAFFHIRFHPL